MDVQTITNYNFAIKIIILHGIKWRYVHEV